MAPLTLAQVAEQQALAEGYQSGPVPEVNPANVFTQTVNLSNPITPVAEPVPYYPPATKVTPNLGLSLQGMDVVLAEDMVILDAAVGVAPIILVSEQFINATAPETIAITAAATVMYAVSIYMNNRGLGSAGQTVTATVTYTAADGSGVQTIDLILPLNTANVVMETYPLLALGGTSITLTTAYGGAYNPAYTIGASIVQMPA